MVNATWSSVSNSLCDLGVKAKKLSDWAIGQVVSLSGSLNRIPWRL
jgi:hypothetical protein